MASGALNSQVPGWLKTPGCHPPLVVTTWLRAPGSALGSTVGPLSSWHIKKGWVCASSHGVTLSHPGHEWALQTQEEGGPWVENREGTHRAEDRNQGRQLLALVPCRSWPPQPAPHQPPSLFKCRILAPDPE